MLLIESKLLENDQLIGEKERAIACLLGVFPFEIRRMSFEELRQILSRYQTVFRRTC